MNWRQFDEMPRTKIKATLRGRNIAITGRRDPRGPDNNIYVWVDEDDQLHVRILKTERCYRFSEMINEDGYVEIIAK